MRSIAPVLRSARPVSLVAFRAAERHPALRSVRDGYRQGFRRAPGATGASAYSSRHRFRILVFCNGGAEGAPPRTARQLRWAARTRDKLRWNSRGSSERAAKTPSGRDPLCCPPRLLGRWRRSAGTRKRARSRCTIAMRQRALNRAQTMWLTEPVAANALYFTLDWFCLVKAMNSASFCRQIFARDLH
jgi:hypothetical protein